MCSIRQCPGYDRRVSEGRKKAVGWRSIPTPETQVTQVTVDSPVRVYMEIIEILSKVTGSHRKKPERFKQKQGHTKVL